VAKRQPKRKASALSTAKNAVRGGRRPLVAFEKARLGLSLRNLQEFYLWYNKFSRTNTALLPKIKPNSYSDLNKGFITDGGTNSDAQRWAAVSIFNNAATINSFVQHRDRFEDLVETGQYADALVEVNAIKNGFGVSLWYIEQRLFLLQKTSGLEEQKKFADEVKSEFSGNSIIPFLADWLSQRNEIDEFALSLMRGLMRRIWDWDLEVGLKNYLHFILTGEVLASEEAIKGILQRAAAISLVDLYEAFIITAQECIVDPENLNHATLVEVIRFISPQISDWRLVNILHSVGEYPSGEVRAQSLVYSRGRVTSNNVKDLSPLDTAYLLSLYDTERDKIFEEAKETDTPSTALTLSVLSEGLIPDEAVRILGLAINTSKLSFSKRINAHLDQHYSVDVWNSHIGRRAFLNLKVLSPYALRYVTDEKEKREIFLRFARELGITEELIVEAARSGVPLVNIEGICKLEDYCDPLTLSLMRIDAALWAEDYTRAKSESHRLILSNESYISHWSSRAHAKALLALGEIEELLRFLVDHAVIQGGALRGLPLEECASALDKKLRRHLSSELCLPVFLDLHVKNCDATQLDYRNYAYEDVLISNGSTKPSQLAENSRAHSDPLLTYYLREICIKEVMQTSSEFTSTKELDEERIKVLTTLVRLDPTNAKEYEEETREITRARLIQQGVKEVAQSKIFVDLASIQRWAEKNVRADFLRFQRLVEAGMAGDAVALKEALFEAIDNKVASADLLQVPKNEAADLLISIVRQVFSKCMSDPEHGLDCFLSMRIRHGTLSGQLRSPLEQQQIITRRDAETNEYQNNKYWENQLNDKVLEGDLGRILEVLNDFSRKYDEFIAHLSNDLIQVKSEDRPEGLMSVALMSHRFSVFYHELDHKTEFDDFMARCFDLFYESLEKSLEATRKFINDRCKQDVVAMFQELEADILSTSAGEGVREIVRASKTASTNAVQSLDVVANWFHIPKTVEIQNFPLEVMIDVGRTCVTTIYQDFDPKVVKRVPELPPFADALTIFTDIFFIIFDNIRVHSGVSSSPKVEIDVEDLGDHLRITTTNELGSDKDLAQVREAVEASRTRIESGRYQDVIPTEGGTGLIKLWRTVSRSSPASNNLKFGLDERDEFFVQFSLPKREISL
jgi:hypothetical protein